MLYIVVVLLRKRDLLCVFESSSSSSLSLAIYISIYFWYLFWVM